MNLLTIDNLTKKYNDRIILDNVSLSLGQGDIVGLIGKNGSGKTTLMKSILGFIRPETGRLSFKNDSNYLQKPEELKKFGFLLDCKFFEYLSGYENLALAQRYSGIKNDEKIKEMLAFVDLENNRKPVKSYSFGMKQRLGLALALLNDPQIIILDEPFVGLDPKGVQLLSEYIRKLNAEKNISILISSHQLHEIEQLCNRFLIIKGTHLSEIKSSTSSSIEISLSSLPERLVKAFPGFVDIQKNKIIIPEEMKILNQLLSQIYQFNLEITHIEISGNNLTNYFEEEES